MTSSGSPNENPVKELPQLAVVTSTHNEREGIRTVCPDEQQFMNPYKLVHQLRVDSDDRGGVKIVPPSCWSVDNALDFDSVQLALVRQSLLKRGEDDKVAFYKDVVRFHKDGSLGRLPSIDKKPLDLFDLRRRVLEKGGFDEVCRKKLWAQIGRELGYTRVMTSLSTSLKVAYSKVLYAYDLQAEPSDEKNGQNKRPMDTVDTVPKKKQSTINGVAHISFSAQTHPRPVTALKSKGMQTHFDSWTQDKLGITISDSGTLPGYDFQFWHKGKEVLDSAVSAIDVVGEISLKTFYEQNFHNVATDDKEFWSCFSRQIHTDVDTPVALQSSVVGSGFPTLNSLNSNKDLKQILSPWNLNNLPLNSDGLLRYLPNENENLISPKLNVGAKYSISAHITADHDAYMCDYHHMGAPKIWYFIDPKDKSNYESLVERLSKDMETPCVDLSDLAVTDALKNDILESLGEDGQVERRPRLTMNPNTWNFELEAKRFNPNLILSPQYLAENGIQCHKVVQNPGEFIVKFPGSYSMTLSLGVNLTESVAFLPSDWIDTKYDKLSVINTLPSFSYFQLLVSIVEESKDPELLQKVYPHLDSYIDEEMSMRAHYKEKRTFGKVVNNKFDYISDNTHVSTLPTKIVLYAPKTSPLIFHGHSSKVKHLVELPDHKFDLHVFYSDEKLRTIQKTMLALTQTPEEWVEKFVALISDNGKPQLKALKLLYTESEQVLGALPEAATLLEYLKEADSWIERAQFFLNAKQKNRIRNRKSSKTTTSEDSEDKPQYDLEELKALVATVPRLNFSCLEIDQVMELAAEISIFENSVRSFLADEGHTVDQFKDMIDMGKSFGVRSDSISLLERIVKRLEWVDLYDSMMKTRNLEQLESYLDEAYEVCGELDQLKIHNLTNKVENGVQWGMRVITDLSNPLIPFEQIAIMLKTLEQVPLYLDVIEKIDEVKQTHQAYMGKMLDLFEIIKANSTLLESLRVEKQKLVLRDESFDRTFHDSVIDKFNGTESDPRPLYSATKEIVENAKEFQQNEQSLFLEIYLRQSEEWWRRMKKLFGKINSPFAMMKLHLSDICERTSFAMNVEDRFVENLPEEEHLTYCFCRRPESGVMIACERCEEWYHCKCLRFGRGKSKKVDNYICPICDHHDVVPREFHCPKLEDVEEVVKEGSFSELKPDHLDVLTQIWKDAARFRSFLRTELPWENGRCTETNVAKVRFYLRKLEGCGVFLTDEYNQLRKLAWELEPFCEGPPVFIDTSLKTPKRNRKPKAELENGSEDLVQMIPVSSLAKMVDGLDPEVKSEVIDVVPLVPLADGPPLGVFQPAVPSVQQALSADTIQESVDTRMATATNQPDMMEQFEQSDISQGEDEEKSAVCHNSEELQSEAAGPATETPAPYKNITVKINER